MFDFLKKKITGFIDKLTNKEEGKQPEPEQVEAVPEIEIPEEKIELKKAPEEKKEPEQIPKEVETPKELTGKPPEKKAELKKKPEPQAKIKELEKKPEPERKPEPGAKKPEPEVRPKVQAPEKDEEKPKPEIPKPKTVIPETPVLKPVITEIPKPEPKPKIETPKAPEKKKEEKPIPAQALPKYEPEKERKKGISLSPLKAIKSFVTREVEISESDVRELLDNLELEMLEADVELSVAESIRQELLGKLVGKKIAKSETNSFIKNAIRETLLDIMATEEEFSLPEYVKSREKPVRIIFLGINGAGKTTTIAKVARLLMDSGFNVVFAAADTFRAAAIEQMEVHANRLGVRMIKRDYGADPTSVAFDAVTYAKAHRVDAVLIDTAGRQDTNVNLINELKKMSRVIQPDLKIYIGESIAGSSVIEQVSTFNKEIGVDGIILTKLDCDPKGGSVLSISRATGIPVIYIGTGQAYEDLEKFDAEKIVDRVLG